MAKNRAVPASVLARLHGKGSMSEILTIERERLRQQSEVEMEKQLGAERVEAVTHQPTNLPTGIPTRPPTELPTKQPTGQPAKPPANQAAQAPAWAAERRITEGLSSRSRFVGEILPGLPPVTVHTTESLPNIPAAIPETLARHYRERIYPALPFRSQRDLLETICRLTLPFGSAACQITLDLLAAASGIRNVKTLRKWLNNLDERGLIRYTPVHGDPRGAIIVLNARGDLPDV